MIAFTLRRLVSGLVLLVVIPTLTFLLMSASSDNVARQILGQNATVEQVAQRQAELGLDRPVFARLGGWVTSALQGDLGRSWFTSEPVTNALTTRLPVTLSIVVLSTLVVAIVALVLGVAAAVYRGWLDTAVQVVAILGFALPGFWLALMLVLFFGIQLGWFPATGYVPFSSSSQEWLRSLALPVASIAIGGVAATAQQIRGSMIDVLQNDWVRTLRSRGVPERSIIFKHALRSAAVPGVTVLALQFIGMFGGAIFVEQIFALPGIGRMIVTSTTQGDLPFVLGVVVVTTVIVVVVNLVLDLLIAFLNPKVRLS